MPWTTTLVDSSTKMLIASLLLLRRVRARCRGGGCRSAGQFDGGRGRLLHRRGGDDVGQVRLLEDAAALLGVGAVEPDDQRLREVTEPVGGLDDAVGDLF